MNHLKIWSFSHHAVHTVSCLHTVFNKLHQLRSWSLDMFLHTICLACYCEINLGLPECECVDFRFWLNLRMCDFGSGRSQKSWSVAKNIKSPELGAEFGVICFLKVLFWLLWLYSESPDFILKPLVMRTDLSSRGLWDMATGLRQRWRPALDQGWIEG